MPHPPDPRPVALLVQGPAAEPVTTAEARAWLRLEDASEDALLAPLVTAARLTVEASARLALVRQTWRLVLDAWPPGGRVAVPVAPVIEVLGGRAFDAAGAATALPAALFALDARGGLRLTGPAPPSGRPGGVEVDLAAGYGAPADVPEPLRRAVLMVTARLFEERGDAPAAAGPGPEAALIAPYRRARL